MKYLVGCSESSLNKMKSAIKGELNQDVETFPSGKNYHHVVTEAPEEYVSKFAHIYLKVRAPAKDD